MNGKRGYKTALQHPGQGPAFGYVDVSQASRLLPTTPGLFAVPRDCNKSRVMQRLSTYIAAIHNQASQPTISHSTVEKSTWDDQGFVVTKEVTDYHFSNSVVIRRTVEKDNFPDEMACAECWITYEVISTGLAGSDITPARKVFENACRESFWLAYHTN